jgi:hypothetical protein
MEDEAKRGALPFEDVNARILACLSHEPLSWVRSIAPALGLVPVTVERHITVSLDMQLQHYRCVPYVLTSKLRDQRGKGSRAVLEVLRPQETTHFRDIVTESWIFIDAALSSI